MYHDSVFDYCSCVVVWWWYLGSAVWSKSNRNDSGDFANPDAVWLLWQWSNLLITSGASRTMVLVFQLAENLPVTQEVEGSNPFKHPTPQIPASDLSLVVYVYWSQSMALNLHRFQSPKPIFASVESHIEAHERLVELNKRMDSIGNGIQGLAGTLKDSDRKEQEESDRNFTLSHSSVII